MSSLLTLVTTRCWGVGAVAVLTCLLGCANGPEDRAGRRELRGSPAAVLRAAADLVSGDHVPRGRLEPAVDGWTVEPEGVTSPGWRRARSAPVALVGSRLPTRADGVWEVGVGQAEARRLRLTAEGARSVALELDRGRAVYRGAWESVDSIVVTADAFVEHFFLLHDAAARAEFAWRVELPAGLPTVRREPGGGLEFLDRLGRPQLRVPRPWAVDAAGERREGEVRFVDGRLVTRVDTAGLAFPVLMDPVIETVQWAKAPVVDGRRYHAMATLGTRVVLFGGQGSAGSLSDTWEWDGTTWTQKLPALSPPARYGHGMATLGNRVVLFGGWGAAGYLSDTWEWDGTTWTPWAVVGPPARYAHAMATRAPGTAAERVVLFGGWNAGGRLADTWEWSGAAWAPRLVVGPAARYWHALATRADRVVLFGGSALAGNSNETWEWTGAAWANVTPAVSPPARYQHALGTIGGRVVLFGGLPGPMSDTWEWDGAAWSQKFPLAPPARHACALAALGAGVVLFGGSNAAITYANDTYEWDGTSWTLRVGGSPSPRYGHAMAPSGTAALLFGGWTGAGYVNDTWGWDGTAWKLLATGGPAGRYQHAMAALGGKVLLFGGFGSAGALGDTWEWDGTSWRGFPATGPGTAVGPSARNGPAMAF
ncbi:MAG: hypothetical protein HY906_06120, partial [Deltaproteobacteria bacterium]|nr:hypothetical protein [Deltaproteobacteria bacterium]